MQWAKGELDERKMNGEVEGLETLAEQNVRMRAENLQQRR
jgi:hypothetical protein